MFDNIDNIYIIVALWVSMWSLWLIPESPEIKK